MTEEERKRLAGQKVEPQSQQEQQNAGEQAVEPAQSVQPAQDTGSSVPQVSPSVKSAQEALQKSLNNKPGAYQSQWTDKLNGILDKILNRGEFNYDANADALYQQYKDRYMQQGKLAMQDTMGQAAALTGGYGNSYAQNAGQQAYNSYLQGLNDKLPELYQMALSKYQAEGDRLNDQAGLLGDKEAQDYGRWQDQNNLWQNDRNFAYGQYQDELGRQDQLDAQDKALAQEQVKYLLSLGVKPNDDLLKKAGYDSQYTDTIWQKNQPASGGSGGGGGYSEGLTSPGGESVWEHYQRYRANGASQQELDAYLRERISAGDVTNDEAATIRDSRPNQNTLSYFRNKK
jgi:hypothetical protein|nr:MAG TPA: hypothetical protein [Caudoviricetes sp.]